MLTLLTGSDTYRLMEAVRGVRATADEVFSGAAGAPSLEGALKYPSLLGGPRRLLVTDAGDDGIADLLSVHDAASRDDIALTAVQPVAAKPSASLRASLKRLASMASEVRTFEPLTGDELRAWIRSFCAERGTTIVTAAADLLLERTDGSWALASELEKLCAYCGTDPIGTADVAALTMPRDIYNQWALSDALQSGDKRGSVANLWTSLARGVPELLLSGTVASSVRTLLTVRDLSSRGLAPAAIASYSGLHPYVVSKAVRFAKASDRTRLAAAHASLAALDRDAKLGRADFTDGLFSILLSL